MARLGVRTAESSAASDDERDGDDSDDSDDDTSDSGGGGDDDDDDDASDEDFPVLGPLQRLSKTVHVTRQRLFDARRHPTLEWKAEQLRRAEQEALNAAEALERQRHEHAVAEKLAKRERREKRKAQRAHTRHKEREFREILQSYELELVKSDTRSRLLTTFAIENRAKEKARVAERQAAKLAADQALAAQQVRDAVESDAIEADREMATLKKNLDAASRIGRRLGTLPSIHSPAPPTLVEQDETAAVVILRVHKNGSVCLGASASAGSVVPPSSSPSTTSSSLDVSVPPAKRQFFTVNLKRFKHADTIRGEGIGDLGAKELARSLLTGACPRTKLLQLGWNGIKFPGTAALADCFVRGACGQLLTLDLRFNLLDAQAFRSLIEAINRGAIPELLDLLLQGNVVGDEGARQLAHAVLRGSVRGLRTIDIRQNAIRNDGMRALWNVFTSENLPKCCPRLQKLDMRRNEAQSALLRSFCPCPAYMEF